MKKQCVQCLQSVLVLSLHYSMAILVLLLLCTYGLIYTSPGLKLLLYTCQHLSNHAFQAERITGHNIGNFSLSKVHYKHNFFHFSARHVIVSWHPMSSLLHLNQQTDSVTLQQVQLIVPHIIHWQGSMKIKGPINNLYIQAQSTHTNPSQHAELHITNSHNQPLHFTLNWKQADSYIHSTGTRQDAHWKVTWQVHLPQLHTVFINTQGSLSSRGNIEVNPKTFFSHFSLQGQHLSLHFPKAPWLPLEIQQLKSYGDIQWIPGKHSHISMQMTGLQFHHHLNTLSLQANGFTEHNRLKHHVAITITPFHHKTISQKSGQLILKGELTRSPWSWQATIRTLTLDTEDDPRWALVHPATFHLSHKHFTLDPLCWHNKLFPTTCLRMTTYIQHHTLYTHLHLDQFPLTLLNTLLPPNTYLKIVQGSVSVDMNAQKSINTQQNHISWTAKLHASPTQIHLPSLNLSVNIFPLTLQIKDQQLHCQAQLKSGQGQLTLQSQLLWNPHKQQVSGEGTFKGQDILMSHTPSYYMVGNPDLVLTIKGQQMTLHGKILITHARIQPHHFNAVVTLPHELTFIDDLESLSTTQLITFNQNLLIQLGQHVSLKLMGLKGHLQGQLHIQKLPQQITQANGQLSIQQGVYQAYGQNLSIEQGQLNFTGGPLLDPSLKILASKDISLSPSNPFHSLNTLTVGIQLNGSLKHLQTHFFSRPAGISDADILSYLVLGEPHSSHTQTSLLQALSSLSLNQNTSNSFNLKAHLQKQLGLHELDIATNNSRYTSSNDTHLTEFTQLNSLSEDLSHHGQTQNDDNNTSVVIGKYLSPKLYLHYNFNMNGNDQLFDISYNLNHHWTLQSQTSTAGNNSVDLLYHIWKD